MPRPSYSTETFLKDIGPLGWIEGLTLKISSDKTALRYFGGIPYALPPVGPYRFRSPRRLPPCYRYGTRVSPGRFTGSAAVCPQPASRGPSDDSQWDENCLQLNIYIPDGKPPKTGWPVFFYIHGGYLQWGHPNETPAALAPLLSKTDFQCICVLPAYRLNALGFLSGSELEAEAKRNGEPAGNMGFWDQRLALEWTWKNITLFGGDHDNITVAGYSAGSHSTFQQLAHELYFVPDDKAIIKRAIMWSNSPGVQPKNTVEHQKQFDEYIQALGISLLLPAEKKLAKLRSLTAQELIAPQANMKFSEFRALSDGNFIDKDIVTKINSGDFALRMKHRGIKLMNGENRDEHNSYRSWRTPKDTYQATYTRLCADYPEKVVSKLMQHYCNGTKSLPPTRKSWQDLFGHIYADMQVHALERGFHKALFDGGLEPGVDVLRYRFDKRMKCIDTVIPPEWEVTHATDMAIWFWGLDYGDGLTDVEKEELKGWNKAFAAFVKGHEVSWGPSEPQEMRRLTADGKTDIWIDDRWDEDLKVWKLVNGQDEQELSRL